MTTTRTAIVVAVVATLAACHGDSEDAAPSSALTVPSSTAVVTSAPTTTSTSTPTAMTTTVVPTTQPPPTTAPMTTTAVTSPPTAPPSTLDPEDQALAEAVERDWIRGTELLRDALELPSDALRVDAALAYTTGAWTEHVRQFVAQFIDGGFRVVADPSAESSFAVESGPMPVAFTSDEVTIVVCEIDARMVLEASAEGEHRVDNGVVEVYRSEVQLKIVDGVWKTLRKDLIESWEGVSTCGG